ncbi:MAG: nucleotidyltransferase domain-containing protein [Candidatus Muiribacteriota bacterium]
MNKNFGLTNSDIEEIKNSLKSFPEINKCVIFGSRAKNNYKPGSDVDIALIGKEVTDETASKLSVLLNEESKMPYFFDVLNFNTIVNLKLKEHIQRVGIEIPFKQLY